MKDKGAMKAVKLIITGKVQGVSYRYYTMMKAGELGLKGYVKNTRSGDVEALFQGPQPSIHAIIEWCKEGPLTARVDRVDVTSLNPDEDYKSFNIRYDD